MHLLAAPEVPVHASHLAHMGHYTTRLCIWFSNVQQHELKRKRLELYISDFSSGRGGEQGRKLMLLARVICGKGHGTSAGYRMKQTVGKAERQRANTSVSSPQILIRSQNSVTQWEALMRH